MNGRAYYNEIDDYACDWLESLIAAGLIAPGDVDRRDIRDVRADDLRGYTQRHFFAGIAGWSLALRLAGWPDGRPVWTGSCPCQPFSAAGKRKGFADERHLWPAWFDLIRECAPPVIFGEQVARAIGQGWLDAVAADLEGESYAVGAAVLPACAVAAPHVRERLWFVAHASGAELRHEPGRRGGTSGAGAPEPGAHGAAQPLADTDSDSRDKRRACNAEEGSRGWDSDRGGIGADDVAHALGSGLEIRRQQPTRQERAAPERSRGGRFTWPPEPDLPRVAHGIPARVAKLRALGNAIVPELAAEFIQAADEAMRAA